MTWIHPTDADSKFPLYAVFYPTPWATPSDSDSVRSVHSLYHKVEDQLELLSQNLSVGSTEHSCRLGVHRGYRTYSIINSAILEVPVYWVTSVFNMTDINCGTPQQKALVFPHLPDLNKKINLCNINWYNNQSEETVYLGCSDRIENVHVSLLKNPRTNKLNHCNTTEYCIYHRLFLLISKD